MTIDYNAKLYEDLADISARVKAGEMSLDDRRQALGDATSRYALAQADAYLAKRAALTDDGRSPDIAPIPYRNESLLHRAADAVMFEDLRWSHPDKMAIVEFPVMSESQHKRRHMRERSISDVHTGKDDVTIGRTRDKVDGRKQRIYDYMTPERDVSVVPSAYLDLYDALDNAGLTDRQAEAIRLVYFEGMTQGLAAEDMNVSQQAVAKFECAAIRKLTAYMTK